MKQKWCMLALIVALLVPLFMLAFFNHYSFKLENGEYTIHIVSRYKLYGYRYHSRFVEFSDFEEMISDIRNGIFSSEEKRIISSFLRNQDGNVIVCDLDHILMPVLPDNLEYRIRWEGNSYFCVAQNNNFEISYTFPSKDVWESQKNKIMDVSNMQCRYWEAGGSKVYVDYGKSREPKQYKLVNSIDDCEKKLYVVGVYSDYPREMDYIMIYGQKDDIVYRIELRPLEGKEIVLFPSLDYLKQFDVVRYTGN